MLYHDLSHEIVGLSMKVQNCYGSHHNERIYQKALEEELSEKSLQYQSQPRLPVISRKSGKTLGWYQPDFFIDQKIILEIKAKAFPMQQFEDQIYEYLKSSTYKLGYLINFGIKPLYYRRLIYSMSPFDSNNLQ